MKERRKQARKGGREGGKECVCVSMEYFEVHSPAPYPHKKKANKKMEWLY